MRRLLLISLIAFTAVTPPRTAKEIATASIDLAIRRGFSEVEWRRSVLAMIHETPAPRETAIAVAAQVGPYERLIIVADALRDAPGDADLIRALAPSDDWATAATFGPVTFVRSPAVRAAWHGRPDTELANAAVWQIAALVNLGRAADAIAVFDALPAGARAAILTRRASEAYPQNPQLDLAACAAVTHQTERAASFLAASHADSRMAMLVRALIAPNDDDPYDVLAKSMFANGVWSEAAATLADRGGYRRFAAILRDSAGHITYGHDTADVALPLLPSDLRSELQSTMERDRDDRAALRTRARSASDNGILSQLRSPARTAFYELPLPTGVVNGGANADCKTWKGPWPQYSLQRCEARGEERLAVAVSSELDPYGAIVPGGWWLYHSTNGGASWEKVYTGVREMQAYSLVRDSRVPMLGDSDVRIEADVHERAPWYVTPRRRVLLAFSLADLRRDTDGDGLPDLVEERIVTDPHHRDTDGDGIEDNSDPLPHIAPSVPHGSAEEEVVAMVLSRFDAAGTTGFFIGDRSLVAGSGVKARLVVLTRDEAEAYSAKFGRTAFGDLSFLIVRRDGKKATLYANYASSGSTYEFEKIDGVWVMHDLGGWVS
jgi:hypothetical protein